MIDKSVRVEFVAYYWSCNDPTHRHKDEDTADKCILKMAEKNARPSPRRWTEDGLAGLIEKHNSGMSYALIGRPLGIGGQQVKNLIYKGYRILKKKNSLGGSELRIYEIVNENGTVIDLTAHTTRDGAEKWLSELKKQKKYEGKLDKLTIRGF